MNDRARALKLARNLLKDFDTTTEQLKLLARELLASEQIIKDLKCEYDPMADLIQANIDDLSEKHREAIRLISEALNQPYPNAKVVECSGIYMSMVDGVPVAMIAIGKISAIIKALNAYHPMHAESWEGWPK